MSEKLYFQRQFLNSYYFPKTKTCFTLSRTKILVYSLFYFFLNLLFYYFFQLYHLSIIITYFIFLFSFSFCCSFFLTPITPIFNMNVNIFPYILVSSVPLHLILSLVIVLGWTLYLDCKCITEILPSCLGRQHVHATGNTVNILSNHVHSRHFTQLLPYPH